MTEPDTSSIDSDTGVEDMTELDTWSVDSDTGLEDTASQNQSEAAENQPNPLVSTRSWFLNLPSEIRLIIYRHVLQRDDPIPYHSRVVRQGRFVRGRTALFFTSRLIRRESIDAFYRENTISFIEFPSLFPSRRIADMIQNISIDILLWAPHQESRELLIGYIHAFGDPAIIRGTFTVNFTRSPDFRRNDLNFYIRALGRFTNFHTVEIRAQYLANRVQSAASLRRVGPLYDYVETPLRFVLGPARPRPAGGPLIFLPHRFLNMRLPRENIDWMDHLEGLRLDGNGDEANADRNVDESEQPAHNSSSQG